ncbi:hypothetical protein FA13DRAFT_1779281 [Coprinellus micaceus]|uniref:Uncharacterized protein n=1 Tax=Coprinellus micaceus TaxID=71717 RepID=A0A4Y7SIL2_COPMI|nr:hypothetical protein FA13DRAFT_1779281 [Coprinellus micaceus]
MHDYRHHRKARHESLAAALENMGSPPPLWRRMATGISGRMAVGWSSRVWNGIQFDSQGRMSAVAIRTFRLEALQRGAESQCFRGTPATVRARQYRDAVDKVVVTFWVSAEAALFGLFQFREVPPKIIGSACFLAKCFVGVIRRKRK